MSRNGRQGGEASSPVPAVTQLGSPYCPRCEGVGWICSATGEPVSHECCTPAGHDCPSSDGCSECMPQPNRLPKRIGLCPSEHVDEFYMPLDGESSLTCPECPRQLAVYVLDESANPPQDGSR